MNRRYIKKVYRVFDTVELRYFQNAHKRSVWEKPGSAKNAWNGQYGGYEGKPTFNEQTRFVIEEFELVKELETCE